MNSYDGLPRVSVVIAVHNCEAYLRSCLTSLAQQCCRAFEIVVVDGASTDKTPEIIEEFIAADPALSIHARRTSENLGAAAARNVAISLASGEYIAVLDGDDWCRADRLAQQAAFLDGHPTCFCVGSVAMSVDADGAPNGRIDSGARTHDDIVAQFLAGLNPIVNSSAMFRRKEAVEILGGYATAEPAATVEDLDFWFRAVLAGLRFHILPDPLVTYRLNPEGWTRTRQDQIRAAHLSRLNEFRRDYGNARATIRPKEGANGEQRPAPAPAHPVGDNVGDNVGGIGTRETLVRQVAPARRREWRGGPIRAAFLTPVLQMGGAEQWILSLIKRSDRERLRWTGVALTYGAPVDGDFCREVAAHAPVYGAGFDGAGVIRSATAREALLAAANDADVLVTWGLSRLGDVLDTLDIPIVYVSHGSGEWSANCARAVESLPVYLAAVSEASRGAFSPAVRNRVRVIHNGIEIDRCTPTRSRAEVRAAWGFDDRHRLVAYAGRYSEEKNPAAAALAVTRLPEHYYAIYAGSGRHEVSVRALVPNIAGARARFVEPERRIGNLLQAFDVLVMAGESEGFSLLLAEAWYCGLPVVSTRVGAVPELEEMFGPLVSAVPVQPTANDLGSAVERALSPFFREEIVPRARSLVEERFTARRMAEQWTDYLFDVCAESAPCAGPSP